MLFPDRLTRKDLNRECLHITLPMPSNNVWDIIHLMHWFALYVRHSRRKFGLLEKHKDYVVRAQAYHKKEDALSVILQFLSCCESLIIIASEVLCLDRSLQFDALAGILQFLAC